MRSSTRCCVVCMSLTIKKTQWIYNFCFIETRVGVGRSRCRRRHAPAHTTKSETLCTHTRSSDWKGEKRKISCVNVNCVKCRRNYTIQTKQKKSTRYSWFWPTDDSAQWFLMCAENSCEKLKAQKTLDAWKIIIVAFWWLVDSQRVVPLKLSLIRTLRVVYCLQSSNRPI